MTVSNRRMIGMLLVAGIVSLWLIGVNAPHVGLYNANNNYLALAAKNYFRFGFLRLGFLPTYYAGATLPTTAAYYLHHPILLFVLSAIPFAVFGFHNWVVHAGTFVFTLGIVAMIYRVGRSVWGTRVAVMAALVASVFPMLTFFWKYMFFEQASVFFALLLLDILIRYVKTKHARLLLGFGLVTFVAALTDWYAGYFFAILAVFFVGNYRKTIGRVWFAYGVGLVAGFGVFLFAVYAATGGFQELLAAVMVRSVGTELFALPYWPLRLGLLIGLRILIYFTPLAVAGLYMWWEALRSNNKTEMLAKSVLTGLLAYGVVNVVVLPTAAWGHSYFLFLLVPFFAYSIALYLDRYRKRGRLITLCVMVFVTTSIAVNVLKYKQVEKQLWKYTVAEKVAAVIRPYETIAVLHYPGDVLEQYFFHPTRPIARHELRLWLSGEQYGDVDALLIACEDACTTQDYSMIDMLDDYTRVSSYTVDGHDAWLVQRISVVGHGEDLAVRTGQKSVPSIPRDHGDPLLRLYRSLRDFLGVGQI